MMSVHGARKFQFVQKLQQRFPKRRHDIGRVVQRHASNELDSDKPDLENLIVEGDE